LYDLRIKFEGKNTNRRVKAALKIFLLLIFISKIDFGQSVNLVIQVNEKLIIEGIEGMYLNFGSGNNAKKIAVDYVPGKLTLNKEAWNIINADTSTKFSLHFDYYSYSNNNQQVANFYADLNWRLLNQTYLVLNIYDFRDIKYKRWYQWHTDKNFLAEFRFPNSGIYIRKKY
jgi:hypothetical protein